MPRASSKGSKQRGRSRSPARSSASSVTTSSSRRSGSASRRSGSQSSTRGRPRSRSATRPSKPEQRAETSFTSKPKTEPRDTAYLRPRKKIDYYPNGTNQLSGSPSKSENKSGRGSASPNRLSASPKPKISTSIFDNIHLMSSAKKTGAQLTKKLPTPASLMDKIDRCGARKKARQWWIWTKRAAKRGYQRLPDWKTLLTTFLVLSLIAAAVYVYKHPVHSKYIYDQYIIIKNDVGKRLNIRVENIDPDKE